MAFSRLAAAVLACLAASMTGTAIAEVNYCRSLEMRLMQLQAGAGRASEARSVHGMLVQRRCRPGPRKAARDARTPKIQARPVPAARPATRARSVTRAKPVASAKPAASARPAAMERPRRKRAARPRPEAKTEPEVSLAGETFRTLCVRSCDGYYFPISFSTTRDNFQSDQVICDQMCPAAGSRLYFHGVDDGGPEDMVSIDGSACSQLPSAFKYRSSVDESCTCRPPGGDSEEAEAATKTPVKALTRVPIAPPPRPRSVFGEDPETLANRAGQLDLSTAREAAFTELEGVTRSVRIVWPERQSRQGDLMISAVPN